jgi:2-haloacid dehalogenase
MKVYKAVLFDLLTALLDSWTLWNAVAGSEAHGMLWRKAYLKRTYECGSYEPYTELVTQAAIDVGLPVIKATELEACWLELQPWEEVNEVLQTLATKVKLGVVTNCSDALGKAAASIIPVPFNVVVTAAQAGFYKPNPQPYMLAMQQLQVKANEVLFVAGSAYDVLGTSKLGIDTYWHNRINLNPFKNMPTPITIEKTLWPLLQYIQ